MVDKVAAIFMIRSDGAALLQHRDNIAGLRCAGMWGLPGGHVEADESMLDCARRELKEETEYNAPELSFLASFDATDEYGVSYQVTYYWCEYDGIQPVNCLEGQSLTFVKRSTAESYPTPNNLLSLWDSVLSAASKTRKLNS